ncbi:hypothetical protein R50073_10670 [Maricurvus nonylphenolicus]
MDPRFCGDEVLLEMLVYIAIPLKQKSCHYFQLFLYNRKQLSLLVCYLNCAVDKFDANVNAY